MHSQYTHTHTHTGLAEGQRGPVWCSHYIAGRFCVLGKDSCRVKTADRQRVQRAF